MDGPDRHLLSHLMEDGTRAQKDLAAFVGLSQPSVAARLKRLREAGVMVDRSSINAVKFNVIVVRIDINSLDPGLLAGQLGGCPRVIQLFRRSGEYNITMYLVLEDISKVEAFVNCHMRYNDTVTRYGHSIIKSSSSMISLPIRLRCERGSSPRCGMNIACNECSEYDENRCHGCPQTVFYKGGFFG